MAVRSIKLAVPARVAKDGCCRNCPAHLGWAGACMRLWKKGSTGWQNAELDDHCRIAACKKAQLTEPSRDGRFLIAVPAKVDGDKCARSCPGRDGNECMRLWYKDQNTQLVWADKLGNHTKRCAACLKAEKLYSSLRPSFGSRIVGIRTATNGRR